MVNKDVLLQWCYLCVIVGTI